MQHERERRRRAALEGAHHREALLGPASRGRRAPRRRRDRRRPDRATAALALSALPLPPVPRAGAAPGAAELWPDSAPRLTVGAWAAAFLLAPLEVELELDGPRGRIATTPITIARARAAATRAAVRRRPRSGRRLTASPLAERAPQPRPARGARLGVGLVDRRDGAAQLGLDGGEVGLEVGQPLAQAGGVRQRGGELRIVLEAEGVVQEPIVVERGSLAVVAIAHWSGTSRAISPESPGLLPFVSSLRAPGRPAPPAP